MYHNGVPRPLHDIVYETVKHVINKANDEATIEAANRQILSDIGIEEFSYTNFISELGERGKDPDAARMIGDYDTEWRQLYLERELWRRDIWIMYCVKNELPIFKADLITEKTPEAVKDLFGLVREFKHDRGVMIPVHGVGSEVSICSMSGEFFDLPRDDLFALQWLAGPTHARLKEVRETTESEPELDLTDQEFLVLKYACAGKSNPVIAQILNDDHNITISERTVARRLSKVYKKFGTNERSVVMAMGRSLGVLVQ